MKAIAVTLIAALAAGAAHAQPRGIVGTDESKVYRHELTIDATSLIKQFVPNMYYYPIYYGPYYYPYYEGDLTAATSTILGYRLHLKPVSLRVGVGVSSRNDNHAYSDTSNDLNRSQQMTARLGIERHSMLSKKWSLFYGLDLLAATRSGEYTRETGSVSDEYLDSYSHVGASPLLGVRWRATKRLHLHTETSLQFVNYNSSTDNELQSNPQYTTHTTSSGWKMQYLAPMSFNVSLLF
jgi:hypothetical protein